MTNVSIIIPAYNQGRFLGKAIESCLGQSHPAVEVVVVDDGSTDDTASVAKGYGDRIRYVRQDNAGLAVARNRGIRESGGQVICFLDSDDWYAPEKVARQVALLDEDPQVGMVYCDVENVDEQGQPLADKPKVASVQRPLSGNLFDSLILSGYFPPHTVMVRRSILDEVGLFDSELGGHADYELWLRIAAAGHRAVFVPEDLAVYRWHGSNMSKDAEHMKISRQSALRKIAAAHPRRMADAIDGLQRLHEDLHRSNQFMKSQWSGALVGAGTPRASASTDEERYDLLRHTTKAVLRTGQADQKAVWEVVLGKVACKALMLHPPAELVFELPTHQRGSFRTAVAMHPDVWNKPGGGGCEFRIHVDGRLAFALAIDPTHCLGDRHWFPVELAVPENPDGPHRVTLSTATVGASLDFRWALWQTPTFAWSRAEEEAPESGDAALRALK